MVETYIVVGSNHNAETNLKKGIDLLQEKFDVKAISPVYESAPVNDTDSALYLNAAIAIETTLQPEEIKSILVAIENACGRIGMDAEGNKSKIVALDFDLLLYGDSITVYDFNEKTYRLPHIDIVTYDFVAIPLAHVAPDIVHPDTKQTMLTNGLNFANSELVLRKDIALT